MSTVSTSSLVYSKDVTAPFGAGGPCSHSFVQRKVGTNAVEEQNRNTCRVEHAIKHTHVRAYVVVPDCFRARDDPNISTISWVW